MLMIMRHSSIIISTLDRNRRCRLHLSRAGQIKQFQDQIKSSPILRRQLCTEDFWLHWAQHAITPPPPLLLLVHSQPGLLHAA